MALLLLGSSVGVDEAHSELLTLSPRQGRNTVYNCEAAAPAKQRQYTKSWKPLASVTLPAGEGIRATHFGYAWVALKHASCNHLGMLSTAKMIPGCQGHKPHGLPMTFFFFFKDPLWENSACLFFSLLSHPRKGCHMPECLTVTVSP